MTKKKVNKNTMCDEDAKDLLKKKIGKEMIDISDKILLGLDAPEQGINSFGKKKAKDFEKEITDMKKASKHIGSSFDDFMEEIDIQGTARPEGKEWDIGTYECEKAEDDISGVMSLRNKKYPWYEELYYAFYRNVYDRFLSPFNFYYWVKRRIKSLWVGFPIEDCWGLDYSTAKWILPRLKRLVVVQHGHPCGLVEQKKGESDDDYFNRESEAWDLILFDMIVAFELILLDDDDIMVGIDFDDKKSYESFRSMSKVRELAIQDGLDKFAKHFRGLWD